MHAVRPEALTEACVPRKAVIPAAGLGTRLQPVTTAIPKEMFPVGRYPAIERVIWEAIASGCSQIAIVISPRKRIIRDYLLSRRALHAACALTFLEQRRPLGFGHALLHARRFCDNESFAVLLPDNLFAGREPPLIQMRAVFAQAGGAVFGLTRRLRHDRSPGPGVQLRKTAGRTYRVTKVLKGRRSVTSSMVGFGRYLLTADCLDHAARAFRTATGELTDGVILREMLAVDASVHAIALQGAGYDIASHTGYVSAIRRWAPGGMLPIPNL